MLLYMLEYRKMYCIDVTENVCIISSIRSNNVDKEVKKQGGGFNKLCSLSPQLQKLLGVSELARTQVTLFYLLCKSSQSYTGCNRRFGLTI